MGSIAYVELEDNNGGIVLNVSEGGLSLAAAGVLAVDRPPRIRIQLPQSREWIELPAEIAWVSESKKEAGIRFQELTSETGNRIKNWVSSEACPAGIQRESGRYSKKEKPLPAQPNGGISDPIFIEPTTSGSSILEGSLMSSLSEDAAPPEIATRNSTSEASFQGPEATPENVSESGNLPGVPERRINARRQINSLLYIELGKSNCGVVVNMSENGLQLEAAAALIDECVPKMRFQLPQSRKWIEASGMIVWVSESRLKGGIRFVDLPADNRASIAEWISREPSQVQSRVPTNLAPKQAPRIDRITNILLAEDPVSDLTSRAKAQSPLISRAVSSSPGGMRSSSAVPVSPAESVSPVDEARKRTNAKEITTWLKTIVPLQSWRSFVAPVAVAAVLSFGIGWFAARQPGVDRPNLTSSVTTQSTLDSAKRNLPPATNTDMRPSNLARGLAPPPSHLGQPANASRSAATPMGAGHSSEPSGSRSQQPSANSDVKAGVRAAESNKLPEHVPATRPGPPATDIPKSTAPATLSRSPDNSAEQLVQSVVSAPSTTPDRLRPASNVPTKEIESATPAVRPPEILVIPTGSVSVNFPAFPSIRVPSELKSQPSRLGTSLQIGQLTSRVDPLYPEDIRRQGIEGTVKVHAIIGRDGAVQSVGLVSGPPLLAPLAMGAVRQWHFKPTLLGGQPIEAEVDITVVFRLASTAIRSN